MSMTTRQPPELVQALDSIRDHIATALPSHVSIDFFRRVVLTALQGSPDLMRADRRSFMTACLRLASTGLVPDGREAALVVFKTKDGPMVQAMPMVAGILKLARQSGDVAAIHSTVVYEGERFVVRAIDGVMTIAEHEISLAAIDGGKPVAVYAVAVMRDGTRIPEVMTWKQVQQVRAVSRAGGGPWATWPGEMARKTVIRRLSKRLPLDREREEDRRLADAIEAQDEGHAPALAAPAATSRGGRLDAIEAQLAGPDDEPAGRIDHDDGRPVENADLSGMGDDEEYETGEAGR